MHDIDLELELNLKGDHKAARAISDKLETMGPDNIPDTKGNMGNPEIWLRHTFNRGWFYLQDGDYQKGCQALECGRYLSVYGSPPLKTDAPIFNPTEHDIVGKSLIISLEGGYGDEIIHARFASSFKKLGASKVYLAADPSLKSLFEKIEGVDAVIQRNQANTVAHDFWIPGFSAGWLAGHDFDNFPGKPYLYANPQSVEMWKQIMNSEKKKVGIRWAGNPKFEHQQFRRFPEAFITNLAQYTDVQFYSLQKDHNILELPKNVVDLQHFLISWEDTAAAIMNLDLVITSCTSIAHLSAALGKETWVIVPALPYHTWAYGCPDNNKSPYYESVTLFRQKAMHNWNSAFQKLYSALEEKFDLPHIDMPDEDKVMKRINLGCGYNKLKDFNNVDMDSSVLPDEVVDLNTLPWPWKENEYSHIVAKDILEHLGETSDDFINVIKEMYRISENGAIWEIEVPHWRCDIALDDPTHKRLLTMGSFNIFNRKLVLEKLKKGGAESRIAFDHGIDIEICDMQFRYLEHWQQKLQNKEITTDELTYALNTFNNVAQSMVLLIQVHKPCRITKVDLEQALNLDR